MKTHLLKAYRVGNRDVRFASCEATDGGITLLVSSWADGARAGACNGIMLTLEERLALTRYLLENPPVIQPRPLQKDTP